MKTTSPLFYVARILGGRAFAAFAVVTFLIVLLLAAVNVTSRHAMVRYVDDQIARVPWDFSVYQTAEVPLYPRIRDTVAATAGIVRTETVFFLRSILPKTIAAVIDGEPLYTPWLSLLTATDMALIPPDIRPEGDGAVLVLVGSKAQMGNAFLNLQNKTRFDVRFVGGPAGDGTAAAAPAGDIPALGLPVRRTVRIDGTELNRWFLENTSSPALIPELGLIVVLPYRPEALLAFDAISRGAPVDLGGRSFNSIAGEYYPDVIHLARTDRGRLISGWDVESSAAVLARLGAEMNRRVRALSQSAAVDNTLGVMFQRIGDIAERIGLISLLVSIPLLWMAWVLLGNVSGLLLLNARRKLGLLRLRGVPGRTIGRALILAILSGGLLGGVFGSLVGTAVPVLIYAEGWLPWAVLRKVQPPEFLALFLVIALAMAWLVSRRFVRFAATISPLAASGRINVAEAASAGVRFGCLQALALLVGGAKMIAWTGGWSFAGVGDPDWAWDLDRAADFVAFPLFVYGLVTLLASRQRVLSALLAPVAWGVGGRMRGYALKHMELSRHRVASFLLIVGLMSSLSLYPTVMTAVFDDKTERGARVQLGGSVQIALSALELMPPAAQARGNLAERAAVLRERLTPLMDRIAAVEGVRSAQYLVEGLVEGLYMPGRGFSGIPLYLVGSPVGYLAGIYHEPALGATAPFAELLRRTGEGAVSLSSAVAEFYKRKPGDAMPVGNNASRRIVAAPLGGVVRFLPGMPLRAVNDREGFVDARVDYINYLFGESPYIVGAFDQANLAALDVLMPRVVVVVAGRLPAAELARRVAASLPVDPLEVRTLDAEVARLGSDMYIFLARENVRIYLIGGLLLALVGILAVSVANYADNRRTLGLLRIRGCGPRELFGFFAPGMFAPSLLGLAIGAAVALVAGYGITKVVWHLRKIQTVLNYLGTELAVSPATVAIGFGLFVLMAAIAALFSVWVFRRTAREGLSDA